MVALKAVGTILLFTHVGNLKGHTFLNTVVFQRTYQPLASIADSFKAILGLLDEVSTLEVDNSTSLLVQYRTGGNVGKENPLGFSFFLW